MAFAQVVPSAWDTQLVRRTLLHCFLPKQELTADVFSLKMHFIGVPPVS